MLTGKLVESTPLQMRDFIIRSIQVLALALSFGFIAFGEIHAQFKTDADLQSFLDQTIQDFDAQEGRRAEIAFTTVQSLSKSVIEGSISIKSLRAAYSLSRKFQNLLGAGAMNTLRPTLEEIYRKLFFKFIRDTAKSSTDVVDAIDGDFPRTPEWSDFRRKLLRWAMPRIFDFNLGGNEVRRLIGLVGSDARLAPEREALYLDIRNRALMRMQESDSKAARKMASKIYDEQWQTEKAIILLVLLSQADFASERDMNEAFVEAVEAISIGEKTVDMMHIRFFMFYYLEFLQRARKGEFGSESVYRLLDLPSLLIKSYLANMSDETLAQTYAAYPFDPSTIFGRRARVETQVEKTARKRLVATTNIPDYFRIALYGTPNVPPMEQGKWNVLIDTLPHFYALKPNFRDQVNLLALIPGASARVLQGIYNRVEHANPSTAENALATPLKLAKVIEEIRQTPNLSGSKIEPPLVRARIILLAQIVLLNSMKERVVQNTPENLAALESAMGSQFRKLKKASGLVFYSSFWESPLLSPILALAKVCAGALGFPRRPDPGALVPPRPIPPAPPRPK